PLYSCFLIPADKIPERLDRGKRGLRPAPAYNAGVLDGRWSAPERAAIFVKELTTLAHAANRVFARPFAVRDGDPDIRVPRRNPQRAFAIRREHQGRARLLHRNRFQRGVSQLII